MIVEMKTKGSLYNISFLASLKFILPCCGDEAKRNTVAGSQIYRAN